MPEDKNYTIEEQRVLAKRITSFVLDSSYYPVSREIILNDIYNDPTTVYKEEDDYDLDFVNQCVDYCVEKGFIKEILIEGNAIYTMYVEPNLDVFKLAVTCGNHITLESLIDANSGHKQGTALKLGPSET